ncbi:MAG: ATP-binding protein [Acidobacteriota bacterium]
MNETRIEMTFDSDLDCLPMVGGVARELCKVIGMDEMGAYNIELCLVECVTNSIRHGYGEERGHQVRLTMTLEARELTFIVEDFGVPLDTTRVREAQARAKSSDGLLEEGGRGMFIMESLMDDVQYGRCDDRNRVIMRKTVEPGATSESP